MRWDVEVENSFFSVLAFVTGQAGKPAVQESQRTQMHGLHFP